MTIQGILDSGGRTVKCYCQIKLLTKFSSVHNYSFIMLDRDWMNFKYLQKLKNGNKLLLRPFVNIHGSTGLYTYSLLELFIDIA